MLKEGDVIELKVGHEVYASVPRHFLYSDCKGDFRLVKAHVKIEGDLAYLAGRYVVYSTATDGGGTGHGPNDVYPDGHHVFCDRLDSVVRDKSHRVDFYQSGCFTAMLPDLKPVATAKRTTWVVEKKSKE